MSADEIRVLLVSFYEGMHQNIYQNFNGHNIQYLYHHSLLDSLAEKSPLLIEVKDQDWLPETIPNEHMLFLYAPRNVTFDELAMQLRKRLDVLFDEGMKGVFHYYLPEIASYFFSLSDLEDTKKWLAPFTGFRLLRQTKFYGNRWYERVWEAFEYETPDVWLLTESQSVALTQHAVDKEASFNKNNQSNEFKEKINDC